MKIVQINTFPYKATGSIMMNIHTMLQLEGNESFVVWGRGRDACNDYEIAIKDNFATILHGVYTRLTDKTGFASKRATYRLIRELERIKPDLIHLHNIHGYYLNIEVLFCYLKKSRIKVVWTFHDCWPFTGHCAYFDMIGCERWRTGCYACPQKNIYPASLMDNSKMNWNKKRELFCGLDIIIVTPSQWLKNIVKQSFLKEYSVAVVHNGVDTNLFQQTETDFYNEHRINNKQIILGVASEWSERKGLKDFITLRKQLDEERFAIVLVGLNKYQIESLPNGIVGVERTSNIQELAGIYSQADFFFNPTYDDNFPTTNLEAVACGTPVITYKTGGSPETVLGNTGWIVEKGDLDAVKKILTHTGTKSRVYLPEQFKKAAMIRSYIQIYRQILRD